MSSNTTKARFKYKPLEEITIKIGSGATPKGGKESYQDHGISLIRSLNVYDFFFDYKNLAFIDENQAKKLNNVKIEPQDLLLNITGASVGRCTIVPNSILPARVNQHVSIVRLDLNLADPLYVLYAINSKYFKNSLLKLSETGATREALTKDDISRFCIPVPPLPVQRKIAAVLSAYDDLIESNTRRIALLEKMAEEIYREWFVRLRFPGHEQVTFHKGIPEDWAEGSAADLAEIMSGGTPKTNVPKYWDGKVPFLTPADFDGSFYVFNTEKTLTQDGLKACSSKLYPRHTVFITARGTVGKLVLNQCPMAVNQTCYALRGKPSISQLYLFFAMKHVIEYFRKAATGGVFDTIVMKTFKSVPFVIPSSDLISRFENDIQPIFRQIESLLLVNERLQQTRDRLLTRLISGKLSVEDLDIQFPPSMKDDAPGPQG